MYVLDGFPIYSLPVQARAFGLCEGISRGTGASCRLLHLHFKLNFAYYNFTRIRLCAVRGSAVEVDFVAAVEIASALLWVGISGPMYVLDGFPIYSLPVQARAFSLCEGSSGGTGASCRLLHLHFKLNFAYSNFTRIRLCAVRGSAVEVDFVAAVEIASALLWVVISG